MNLVHNERVKLLANLLNTVAGAAFGAGLLVPLSIALLNPEGVIISLRGVVYVTFWIVGGAILHGWARLVLKGLRE